MLLEWIDYYSLLFLAPFLALEFFWRARGYEATLVSGIVTMRNGEHTGALPGRLVRGAQG